MAAHGAIVIIKKKKKGGHDGHHGGAWKVAYADFVTAMMAFFLLLWLLNVATQEQKEGIADYFAPSAVSFGESGSGGVLGGRTITAPGPLISPTSPLMDQTIPGMPGSAAVQAEQPDAQDMEEPAYQREAPGYASVPSAGALEAEARRLGMPGRGADESLTQFARRVDAAQTAGPQMRRDENSFAYQARLERLATAAGIPGQELGETLTDFAGRVARAGAAGAGPGPALAAVESLLRQTLSATPQLRPFAESVMLQAGARGLSIQIVDQDRRPMFPSGSSQMFPRTRDLMTLIGRIVARLPNDVSISGHTDGRPFRAGTGRDNWDLSADRANASRRVLTAAGVVESRIRSVAGRADREPLEPGNPNASRNRRISILLHRDAFGADPALPGMDLPAQ